MLTAPEAAKKWLGFSNNYVQQFGDAVQRGDYVAFVSPDVVELVKFGQGYYEACIDIFGNEFMQAVLELLKERFGTQCEGK